MWYSPCLRPLILAPLLFASSACTHTANDSWTGKDKTQHFFVSAVLAAAGTAYGERQNWQKVAGQELKDEDKVSTTCSLSLGQRQKTRYSPGSCI